MTSIDFYITVEDDEHSRHRLACRLADKAYRSGRQIYIHTESPQEAKIVDDMLWTFRAGSFIPHSIEGDADTGDEPVVIGRGDEPRENNDVLINLAREVPEFFSRFERVAEIVDSASENKQCGRERYSYYRDRGYPLKSHNV